jgi:hypothetical protein
MAKLSVSKTELGGSNPSAPASFEKTLFAFRCSLFSEGLADGEKRIAKSGLR